MTIEITPDDADVFYSWSGDPSGTENPLVITMGGVITVGAVCTSAIYQNYCTEADQFLISYDGDEASC